MELTIQVNQHERTVRFREVSSLAAGDVCSVTLDGVRGADLPSLRLVLYRDAASASPVASCPSFSAVPGHPNLASGTLGLDTSEMAAWFDAVRPDDEPSDDGGPGERAADAAERAVRTDGWLVVSDSARTWAACRVPVILRPGAGTSGVVDPASLASLVGGLVSAAMSGALSGKADKGEMSVTPGTGADAGKTTIQLKAGTSATVLTEHQDVSGKADKGEMSIAAVAGHADRKTIQLKAGTRATVLTEHQDVGGKLDGAAAYPAWDDSSFHGTWPSGTVVSWEGKLYRTEGGTANPVEPGTPEGADDWAEITIQSLLAEKANASDVNAALAQKASLTDLPYAMVTPGEGEWEFSDGGTHVIDGPTGAGGVWFYSSGPRHFSNTFSSEAAALSALELTFTDWSASDPSESFTATRASLPGQLLDRANNLVPVTENTTLTLPPLVAGKVRDFCLRMTVTGSRQVSFLPAAGITYTGFGDPAKTYSAGTYLLRFTETAENEFCVADMLAQIPDVAGKADKVSGATAGNLAALTAQGNLADSGVKPSDFATPSDLPYALVTPGEWEFSELPSGYSDPVCEWNSSENVMLLTMQYEGDDFEIGNYDVTQDSLSVSFRWDEGPGTEAHVVTATRASLPGHLLDRAVNAVPVSSATEITLPEKLAGGKSRDFYVRLAVSAESAVTFAATDSGGDAVSWDAMGSPSATLAAGTYLYRFTEVADGVFHAADVTSGGSIDPAVLDEKLDASSAAPLFSDSLTYLVGEYVTYGGVLYRCKTAVTVAGAWTGASNWEADDMTSPDATLDVMSDGRLRVVTVAGEDLWMQGYDLESTSAQVLKCEKVNLLKFPATAAEAFDSTVAYAVGDSVVYGGMVYKFTAAHSAGAWVGTDAAVDSVSLTMPYVPVGKVGDFVLDVDNSANASVKMTAELSGLFTAFDVYVDKGRNLSDLLTFDGGEQCELYFTMTAFGTLAKPAWKVVKQVVEKQEAGA